MGIIMLLVLWVICGFVNYKFLNWYFCGGWDPDISDIVFVFLGGFLATMIIVIGLPIDMLVKGGSFKEYFKDQIAYHNEKKNHNNYYYDWRERLVEHRRYLDENDELEKDLF